MSRIISWSAGNQLFVALLAAGAFSANYSWSQVTYTDYSVNWGVYDSTGTSLVGGALATGTVRIGNSVDTTGSETTYSPNASLPSWFDPGFSLVISGVSGGPYTVIKEDLTSLTWANSLSNPSVNPTTFKFSGSEDPTLPAWTLTASGSQPLEMTFTVVGGSSTSYVLKQSGSFSAVPEPEEWAAIASSGLLAFAIWHRRSRKAVKA